MIKPSPSKNEPQLSKSQQRISKNEPSKSVQTLGKSGNMQNNNYGTGDEKQKPGQKQNIGQTSKMPNTMSKFQVIPSKNDGRNGKAINNISKSLPTGQLKSIQGLQNVVPPGQTSKTKNDLSKSQIISSKNKQMDTTTNNLVKSMPAAQLNNLKGRQDLDKKSQQQRLNRPQPDGQVSKNQTGQKSTTKTESIQAQGQKSGMLPANMQKSQQQQNRPNNSQTSYQKGLPPLKQQNTVNKGQQNQDKAGNLVSNKMTSQPNTQKSVNQQSRVQQNTQNLAKQSNTFPKVSQNAENQQNNSQKNQLRQQKLGNQANNLQKTQTNTPKPANKPNKPNGQMKGNPADIVKTSIESGQKPGKQQNDLKKGMNPLKPANTGKSIQNYGNTGSWSYGVLLWEIFTLGGNPYPSVPVERLFELLKEGHRMGRPPYASEIINKTMQSCWHENPSGRPSFNNLVIDFNKMLTSMDNRGEWESLQHRRWKQCLVLCYKTQHEMIAIHPAKYYTTGDSRTRGNHKFRKTRVKRDVYYHSFFPRTTREWNKLPESVVESGSLEDFRARVNTIPWTQPHLK
ncbi:unnamed protein product [Mytilus edulis]|uniref:Tyrosine-protein kinase catalytic domain-containing protein n=1 Tax=Mytilus edulis TaxID=6550 RepID=A0A8S3RMV9_MYTED|nr:unnamed protein product [Mytilus edulis]